MLTASNQIDIDIQEVLNNIGYRDDYQPSARISSLVNDYIENYHDLIAPSYSYVFKDIIFGQVSDQFLQVISYCQGKYRNLFTWF